MFKSSLWLLYNYYCFADLLGIIRWSLFSLLNAESLHERLVHLGGLNVEASLSRSLSTSSGISDIAGKKHRLLFLPLSPASFIWSLFPCTFVSLPKSAQIWRSWQLGRTACTRQIFVLIAVTVSCQERVVRRLDFGGSRRVSAHCTRARLELEDGERRRRGCGKDFTSVFICARVSVWACVPLQRGCLYARAPPFLFRYVLCYSTYDEPIL